MNTEEILALATEVTARWAWATETSRPEPNRLDVKVKSASDLVPMVVALRVKRLGYLSAITGLDLGSEAGELEILYHFCTGEAVITLRARVPREMPSIPSLCQIIPSAEALERELSELFGVTVVGLRNPEHLYLPDEWPEGVYPLRKDCDPQPLLQHLAEGERVRVATRPVAERFAIPIGPQHPALKEPSNFLFTVDGEIVTNAVVRLGYAHRGIEKSVEGRNWVQNLYLLERICGICSHIHATAYCLGVERLAGVQAPPRAQAIRVLVAELERIHSHFLWLGVAAHEAGFDTLFMYTWRDRETVMDLLEGLTGNRVNYSVNVLGGVKCDVDAEQAEAIRKGLDFLEARTHHYLDVISTDAVFLQRTRIGVMTRTQAEVMGTVGPVARASNIPRDIRVEAPYAAYSSHPVNMVLETRGDVEARFIVRIKELFECYRLIREILDTLPPGELTAHMPRRIKPGDTISRVEAPRGELFYFIESNGTDKPERIRVRTPTIFNMMSVVKLAIGHQLADVPMIMVGIDPCFSCNDRMIVIERGSGEGQRWTWEALRQYGIEHYRRSA